LGPQPKYRSDEVVASKLLPSINGVLDTISGERQGPQAIVAGLLQFDPVALTVLRNRARQLRAGRVQILGLSEFTIGSIPNWHRDPASGVIAPKLHWSGISYLDAAVAGDHKSLWELNRHQYLYAPALVWLAEGDEADFQLVQGHLSSWLDQNPPAIGVNWASSLEVAYRAITWCWLLWLLQSAPWNQQLLGRMGDALLRSGLHIERNLSVYFSPNTHLTGEALSLCYLGQLLPPSRHSNRWYEKGSAVLESWLARQIYPDGVYTEQAVLYQRYTAEIYLHYAQIAKAGGRRVSTTVMQSLRGVFEVLRGITSADARLPLIGDDDGGQLLPLDQRAPEHAAGVLLAGATALGRPELVPAGQVLPAMSYAVCGVTRTNDMLSRATPAQVPRWRDRYFPDGGVAVLRDDWTRESAVSVIDAGPHGVLNCGHAHADALAMTLSLGAEPIFIDRGTLTYVGAERNEYRSTMSHNTLEFDAESSVTPLGPFQWGPTPMRPTGSLTIHEDITLFRALAPGHAHTDRQSVHRRVVVHERRGAWVVLDTAERAALVSAVVRWQLAPGLTAATHNGALEIRGPGGQNLAAVAIFGLKSLTQSVREVSLCYGHRAPAIVIEAVADPAGRLVTLIVPASGPGAVPRLSSTRAHSATICEWTDPRGLHQLWVPYAAGAALLAPGDIQTDSQALWLTASGIPEQGGTFSPQRLVALGAHSVRAAEMEKFVTGTPESAVGDVVAGRRGMRWAILPGLHPATSSESV
jgi:hypothetical protein